MNRAMIHRETNLREMMIRRELLEMALVDQRAALLLERVAGPVRLLQAGIRPSQRAVKRVHDVSRRGLQGDEDVGVCEVARAVLVHPVVVVNDGATLVVLARGDQVGDVPETRTERRPLTRDLQQAADAIGHLGRHAPVPLPLRGARRVRREVAVPVFLQVALRPEEPVLVVLLGIAPDVERRDAPALVPL